MLVQAALRQILRHQEDAPLTLHSLATSLEVSPFRLIRKGRTRKSELPSPSSRTP